MRHALGLDLPERRISLSAHDFAQALGADEVILAYPAKLAGAPTVSSRFVQRLAAVAGEERWQRARANGARYLAWARALDQPAQVKRIDKPAPKPPRAARPTALSVTEIESWLRDPYTIYAKHILALRELDPVDLPPGAADRGIVIHGALSEFTKTFAGGLPADPAGALIEIGSRHFAALEDYPEARAFWWPRFQRIARWFAGWEAQRRSRVAALTAETYGKIEIPLGDARVHAARPRRPHRAARRRPLCHPRLQDRAGADRAAGAHRRRAAAHAGGRDPAPRWLSRHRRGGIGAELIYVSLKGGAPAGEDKTIDFKDGDADDHAERALAKLAAVAERFEDEQQPYLPLVLSMWKSRYGTYDHLARVKEWSVGGSDDEDAEAANERRDRPRTIPEAVLRLQVEASDPAVSAWVAANAGSGKTHVLAQRVIRLLLDGVEPAKILCITFTKAAAANMANRVFDELRRWTALDDAGLDAAIGRISDIVPDAVRRARARRLFALALDTPGGLKVQTIHAFCTRLLHQFPFEANVAARFEVLDEAGGNAAARRDQPGRAARRGRGAGRRARPGARDRDRKRRRPDVQGGGRRSDPQARSPSRLDRARRQRRSRHRRSVRDARHHRRRHGRAGRERHRRGAGPAGIGMDRGRGGLQHELVQRSGAMRAARRRVGGHRL